MKNLIQAFIARPFRLQLSSAQHSLRKDARSLSHLFVATQQLLLRSRKAKRDEQRSREDLPTPTQYILLRDLIKVSQRVRK
jgi:hypothetical protein